MSKRRPAATDAEFEQLLTAGTVTVMEPVNGRWARTTKFILAAVVTGVAIASLSFPGMAFVAIVSSQVAEYWDSLPEELPLDQPLPQHTVLLDKDGAEFARFVSEDRVDINREQISDTFIEALIASEDREFMNHGGVDVKSIIRAAVSNIAGNARQGASTITQQYVQNLLISNARDETEKMVAIGTSMKAKVQEARYSIWVEQQLTKDEILTRYSNAVFFGNGAYGVEAAARTYFSIPASELNVPQSATLISIVKAPSVYDPITNPEAALKRRNVVIASMVNFGAITAEEGEAAQETEIELVLGSQNAGCGASAYPHFCSLVQMEILADEAFGATTEDRQETLRRGGLTITTTLDRAAANTAQAAAVAALAPDNRVATGIAVVQPGTGHIMAVGQNHAWDRSQIVYATSRMQPGSVMKPIALAAALESGFDIGTRYSTAGPYAPAGFDYPADGFNNYQKQRYGTVDAATAIRQSVNVYFIKMSEEVGVKRIADIGRAVGLKSLPTEWSGREISLALGTYETSPLEMANAYATFAAGGVHCDTTTVAAITVTSTGEQVPAPEVVCTQAISNGVAQQINAVTQGAFARGGTLASVGALPGRVAGGKTGTTDGAAAVWTAGMTPQYATAVWVGDPRGGSAHPLVDVVAYGRPLGVAYGAAIAGPIWKEVMTAIHSGLPAAAFGATGQVGFPSEAKPQVPNVVGLKLSAAVRTLVDAGFKITVEEHTGGDRRFTTGTVTAQSVEPGTAITKNPAIALTLSPGSDTDVVIEPTR